VSGTVVPRFAGPSIFARLPELWDVSRRAVAMLGIPFDGGTSYRPGARFGPQAIRAYDHAEITSLAAATVAYELVNLFACRVKDA
jgi:arginase family enzyme